MVFDQDDSGDCCVVEFVCGGHLDLLTPVPEVRLRCSLNQYACDVGFVVPFIADTRISRLYLTVKS